MSAFSRDLVSGYTGHLGGGLTYSEYTFGSQKETSISVPVATVDSEVESKKVFPNLLKMDVEGYEYEVLQGSVRTLKAYRPLVVSELNSWESEGGSGREIAVESALKLFTDLDYALYDLDGGRPIEIGKKAWMVLGIPAERKMDEWPKIF